MQIGVSQFINMHLGGGRVYITSHVAAQNILQIRI